MNALIDIVLRSSLVLLIGLVLMPLLARRSAALRHWVLFTTLMCAAAVPVVSAVVPGWRVLSVQSVLPELVVQRVAALNDVMPAAAPAGAVAPRAVAAETIAWPALVMPMWVVGATASLIMLIVGIARLHRVHREARPVDDRRWCDSAPASVRVTERPGLLLVWGVLRPTIIVSQTALGWTSERVAAVLQHELTHVRRHDWLLLIAAETVRAIYWFNPLVWVTCARLRAEAELACDDAVIANGTAGPEYATHVLDIARDLTARHWLPAPAMVRQSTLERRVRAMLDKSRNRTPLSRRAGAIATAVIVAATLAVAAQSFVSLSGRIVDPTQGVLPGVKLVLVNEQTNAKYEIQTDRSGRYEFVGLPPGAYVMTAAIPGFSQFSARVTVGTQNLQQDLTMSIGTIQETITLTPGATSASRVTTPDPERTRRIEELRAKRAANCASPQTPDGAPIGGNIAVPLKLRDVRPLYPEALQAVGGTVVLNATISTSGTVQDVSVVSSPHPELSQAASDAVSQWVFEATLLNCEAIDTPMNVTVNFKTQ